MQEINLIWATKAGSQTEFEREFIVNRVFGAFAVTEHFMGDKYDLYLPNSCVIFSHAGERPSKEFAEYLFRLRTLYRFMVYHLSDEKCEYQSMLYFGASAVLRSYYHPKYKDEKNIYFMPLGFQSGFMDKDNKNSNKTLSATFSGSMKQDRQMVVDVLKKLPNSLIRVTEYFNDPTGFPVEKLIEIYNKTLFVPCPMGWNHADSFRIMEALECGAIPVIKHQDKMMFELLYPNNPFLLVDNWNDLIRHYDALKPFEAVCLKNVRNWYSWYKKHLKNSVKHIYETHISNK